MFYADIESHLCNYADDNYLCNDNNCTVTLKKSLEDDSARAICWFDYNGLNAHADKFNFIAMDRNGQIPLSISVQGNTLSSSDNIKVLGVILDSNLRFDIHVSKLCSKASNQINVLKRLSKFLNSENRLLIYKSFISSNFSYCPVSWLFCGKQNSSKLEKLQERALRFVFSDLTSSYHELLTRGNLLSLSALRVRFLAIEVYKCVNGLNPPYLNDLFEINDTGYNLRDNCRLKQPKFSTMKYGFRSFRYYGSKLWNTLPVDIKNSESIYSFKQQISEWCRSTNCDSFI